MKQTNQVIGEMMNILTEMSYLRKCIYPYCDKIETYNGKCWKENWCRYQEGFLCHKHYKKLVVNPKRSKEYIKKYNDRRTPEIRKKSNSMRPKGFNKKYNEKLLRFKDKRITLGFKPRTGQCQLCGNKIGEEYIDCHGNVATTRKIDIHHIEYDADNPLATTIELCYSCHSKETWKQRGGG